MHSLPATPRRAAFALLASLATAPAFGQVAPVAPGDACAALAGRSVSATAIGLPSGEARVATATLVAATPQNIEPRGLVPAVPEHCRLLGTIAPVDPQAEPIGFQVNLPTVWNGKALQYGGGGYNGTLVTGLAPLRDAAPGDPLPLARGYVTLGTDSGHRQANYPPDSIARFGMNDEMLVNYGYASYKKVRDVAVALMRAFYGRAPERIYYFGGSEGGREGLTMAQRFPADYDGIVSVVPVVQLSMLFQSYLPRQIPQMDGAWMSPAKVATLGRFVAEACDALDGIADGVVNNYLACPARVELRRLRCEGGGDTGEDCLSDAQIAVVESLHRPLAFPFAMANRIASYPQFLYGNETTPDPMAPTMTRWVTGRAPPSLPIDPATASQGWLYGVNFVRFFVARDAAFDPRRYRPEDFAERLRQVSAIIDSTDPDLSAFFARGGRLILRENAGDLAQSPLSGIDYFRAVEARVGGAVMEGSARLYVSPASNHSGPAASVTDGAPVPTMVDLLDPLDRWVTRGEAPPDALVQTLSEARPPFALRAARPMCRYPGYPHYTGGDPRVATSYACRPSVP